MPKIIEAQIIGKQFLRSGISVGVEMFKQFMDNQSFKKWLTDTIFNETYKKRTT